jgi:hypothetical protein
MEQNYIVPIYRICSTNLNTIVIIMFWFGDISVNFPSKSIEFFIKFLYMVYHVT